MSSHSLRYRRVISALKQARIRAHLNQLDVAAALGVYASFVSKIESCERRLDVVEFADLCELYGVKASKILKAAGIE